MEDSKQIVESSPNFEEKILKRIQNDYKDAQDFMDQFHRRCLDRYRLYHSSAQYEELRKTNRLPDSFFQEQIDVCTADIVDKLFYNNRPCNITPAEDSDKGDAEAKQQLMDWQDYKEHVYRKIRSAVKDVALYGVGIGQVDFKEEKKRRLIGKDVPRTYTDSITGMVQPVIDPMTGEVVTDKEYSYQDIFTYKGAAVHRVDPLNFFITSDKSEINDEHPVMVRSEVTKSFLRSQDWVKNTDKFNELSSPAEEELTAQKREILGLDASRQTANRNIVEYVEWQGKVNKAELYQYLGQMTGEEINPDEEVWLLAGMANKRILCRCQESPFETDGPNIVVGCFEREEGEMLSFGIGEKIAAIAKNLEVLNGVLMENLKQAVNAQVIIDKTALVNTGEIKVNRAGGVILVNKNPQEVFYRIEQPKIANDLYAVLDIQRQRGQNASGVQDLIAGRGDQAIGTATETNAVAMQASLRMRDFIRCFEESFIEPLYQMRNQINMQFLNQEYVYGVIGNGAIEWRIATPDQIRSSVDFVCQASSRETQRAVITQQLIQLAQPASLAEKSGYPFRWDLFLQNLVESGMTWSREQTERIIPSLKWESDGQIDLNQVLFQKFIAMQGMNMAMIQAGTNQAMNPPEPNNEQEAIQSATQRNTAGILP